MIRTGVLLIAMLVEDPHAPLLHPQAGEHTAQAAPVEVRITLLRCRLVSIPFDPHNHPAASPLADSALDADLVFFRFTSASATSSTISSSGKLAAASSKRVRISRFGS